MRKVRQGPGRLSMEDDASGIELLRWAVRNDDASLSASSSSSLKRLGVVDLVVHGGGGLLTLSKSNRISVSITRSTWPTLRTIVGLHCSKRAGKYCWACRPSIWGKWRRIRRSNTTTFSPKSTSNRTYSEWGRNRCVEQMQGFAFCVHISLSHVVCLTVSPCLVYVCAFVYSSRLFMCHALNNLLVSHVKTSLFVFAGDLQRWDAIEDDGLRG